MIVNFHDANITYAPSYDEALEKGRCQNIITYSRDYQDGRINLLTDGVAAAMTKSNVLDKQKNVAWIMEPVDYIRHVYDTILEGHQKFDLIMTHNLQMLEFTSNSIYIPANAISVDTESTFTSHEKKKMCSMIYSDKKSLIGHKLRYEIVDLVKSVGGNVDFFGTGTGTRIDRKSEGLNDYCFSISVENSASSGYFTEKLLDCFATKTIPIYWGDDYAWNIFDRSGAIIFDHPQEIPGILQSLSFEKYTSMIDAIERNWQICSSEYHSMDAWVLKNIKEKYS